MVKKCDKIGTLKEEKCVKKWNNFVKIVDK